MCDDTMAFSKVPPPMRNDLRSSSDRIAAPGGQSKQVRNPPGELIARSHASARSVLRRVAVEGRVASSSRGGSVYTAGARALKRLRLHEF